MTDSNPGPNSEKNQNENQSAPETQKPVSETQPPPTPHERERRRVIEQFKLLYRDFELVTYLREAIRALRSRSPNIDPDWDEWERPDQVFDWHENWFLTHEHHELLLTAERLGLSDDELSRIREDVKKQAPTRAIEWAPAQLRKVVESCLENLEARVHRAEAKTKAPTSVSGESQQTAVQTEPGKRATPVKRILTPPSFIRPGLGRNLPPPREKKRWAKSSEPQPQEQSPAKLEKLKAANPAETPASDAVPETMPAAGNSTESSNPTAPKKLPGEKHIKRSTRRKYTRELRPEDAHRDAVIFCALTLDLEGEEYCKFLSQNRVRTPSDWWKKAGMDYREAFKKQAYKRRIYQQKNRAKNKMERLKRDNPKALEEILRRHNQAP